MTMQTIYTREGFDAFRERMCDQLAALPDGLGKRPLHVEQAELAPNSFFTHSLDDQGHHIVYDPRQVPAVKVRVFLGIYATFTEGPILDGVLDAYWAADCDNVRRIWEITASEIDRTQDPDGVVNRLQVLFARERTEKTGARS